jgi:SAM-dependent methyltransferase
MSKSLFLSPIYKMALGRLLGWGLSVNHFGYPSGYSPVPTPARHYIDLFLEKFRGEIRGRCVEFMPPYYRERCIARGGIESYDVWDVEQSPVATIVGDLQSAPQIASASFDCIIATHVLCNIARPWLASAEMLRILKPGGVVLCTVPMVLQGHAPHPRDYWRFTPDTLPVLFEDFSRVEVHSYGNAATASGSPQFLMKWHFPKRVLNHHDPRCPSIVACAAWK